MRLLHWIGSVIIILGGFAAISAPTWIGIIEPNPVSYSSMPISVEPKHIRAGDSVAFTAARCNTTSYTLTALVYRVTINDDNNTRFVNNTTFIRIPPGCIETVTRRNDVVPEFAPPGRYRLEGIIEVRTQFKAHFTHFYTEEFEILR